MKDFNELNEMDEMNENENNKKAEKKNQKKKMVKKGLSISLCAVLAGGLAVGSYHGFNYLNHWSNASSVQAAENEATLTLLKAKKSSSSDSDTADTTDSTANGSLNVSSIVENAMPSVVSISTKSVQEVQDYYGIFSQYGYAPQEREVEGSGSGIIIGKNDSELLIVTNYHVVEGADTLSVGFVDNNAYEAKVKGYDNANDLAVVSVSLDDISDDTMDAISVATIGSSDDLKVGEQVIAIGNALGYGQSVTTGIVSAKNRRANSDYSQQTVQSDDEDNQSGINLIQTDAAINPGNSGGALLNMKGEVVGINSAKLASTEVEGIGYAIAISDVTDDIENLMNEKTRDKVEGSHGVLGISGRTVSDEASQYYGIPEGVFVADVTKGGAAEAAGIKQNSIITKFDGKAVTSIQDLVDRLEYYEPDEKVEVTVATLGNGSYEEDTVEVTLGSSADQDQSSDDQDSDVQNSDDQSNDGQSGDNLFDDFEQDGRSGLQFGDGVN
nr:trypsin-like peptidase domain-containing protein [uncultured Blautia sp.]